MMDCLYAKCIPCITDCVMAEIEKLGQKYRVALRIAKDPRFERLPCTHKGTYADDCLVQRVTQHKCYIVATVDRDLKRRIRKIPGVPIMYISNHSPQTVTGQLFILGQIQQNENMGERLGLTWTQCLAPQLVNFLTLENQDNIVSIFLYIIHYDRPLKCSH
ncbi:rRNA-processing protein FCF1 homolog isoform X3 [Hippopotamus amphibius kiboko]|nr:rRNA-processing protein FCF1 homolog isoform X3 [Hippopotamus amphibius kiboko]XP_057587544.1 rRNA-processing protein FCF1 homolog isoform X3 [Hippopotamus amphibius kiboko]XP_057587545.1 rRNA-processing protein FCF1 homolog isoform X3 [Hippopotamus amphibius kiboko]XP_057587546.1 rRNA-processing protein FCF1 homolog isoform X3 [Hippopotamus amphibius kiboko]